MSSLQVIEPQGYVPAVPAGEIVNGDWVRAWLDGRGMNTRTAYLREIWRFLDAIGWERLDLVSNANVREYDAVQRALREAGTITANTHRLRLNAVRAFYSFACETWPAVFKVNPARKLTLPAVRRHLGGKVIAEDTVLAIVAGETDPLRRAVVRVLYSSGMRVSELCGLCCGHVHEVEDQRGKPAARLNVWGKGEQEREAGISAGTWAEVKPLWEDRDAGAPLLSLDGTTPLTRHQVARMIQRCGRTAGVERATPHRMRHSHITHAISHGCDRSLVRRQAGHSSEAVTGWYTDLGGGETSADYLRL